MNKILILVIIPISLLACNSSSSDKKAEIKNTEYQKEKYSDQTKLIQLSNKLQGYWLSEPYLQNIERTKSIYENRDYTTSMFGFILKKDELIENKSFIHGFSSHEGGIEIPLIYNSVKNIFETNPNNTNGFKQTFELKLIDDSQIELSFPNKKELYRKVVDEDTELRKILLAGSYTDVHSKNEIEFSMDGNVSGIPDYNFYDPYYDFGEGLWMDAIFLSNTLDKKASQIYHYKINNDTLSLYPVEGEIPDFSVGELKYDLVKQK